MRPDVDDLVVALFLGHQARGVLGGDLLDLLLRIAEDRFLLLRDDHVIGAKGDAGAGGVVEARVHELVGQDHGVLEAGAPVALVDQRGDGALVHVAVDQRKGHAFRQHLGEDRAPDGRLGDAAHGLEAAVLAFGHVLDADLHPGMQADGVAVVGALRLLDVGEGHAGAALVDFLARQVVQAEHDVLGGHDDRAAVGRREHVVGRHDQRPALQLGLHRQRHVNGHLVAVEIGVEGRAHQRVQLDGLALDQDRLERLDAEAMQRRCAVQQHRVLADDFLEDVPDLGAFLLDHLLAGLDGRGDAAHVQLAEDERLEQFQRHLLGQAALVQLQGGPDDDDRAPGIVHALAEQVLAEAALLALDHVRQGLQRPTVGAGDRPPAPPVVEQRIDRFLQHALFVAHDDVRGVQLQQAFQAVVAVDGPAVQVVEVRGGEAPAVQVHQRAQVRRQHRQDGQHHPLGLVAGLDEILGEAQALGQALELGFRAGLGDLLAKRLHFLLQVHLLEQLVDGLRAHARIELVAVGLDRLEEGLVGEQLLVLEPGHARVDDDEGLEIQHALDVAQGHVEQQADARRQ